MPKTQHSNSERSRYRSRSRSPNPNRQDRHRERSRSPRAKHHHSRHEVESRHKRRRSPEPPRQPVILPFKAKALSKHDFNEYKPTFASYLDIQKQLYLEDLPEDEVRGRWKSFVGKWNRKELAEGWYDPETKRKADVAAQASPAPAPPQCENDDDDSADDVFGPTLPTDAASTSRRGPHAPTFEDLADRDALLASDASRAHSDFNKERLAERKQQKERLDDLAPRAEPGTRERQLEKKREGAAASRAFRDERGAKGEMEEVGDSELMGGGADEVRRARVAEERRKNEREVRKEEVLRARQAEREDRLKVAREKENRTVEMLKAIAKERFG